MSETGCANDVIILLLLYSLLPLGSRNAVLPLSMESLLDW